MYFPSVVFSSLELSDLSGLSCSSGLFVPTEEIFGSFPRSGWVYCSEVCLFPRSGLEFFDVSVVDVPLVGSFSEAAHSELVCVILEGVVCFSMTGRGTEDLFIVQALALSFLGGKVNV